MLDAERKAGQQRRGIKPATPVALQADHQRGGGHKQHAGQRDINPAGDRDFDHHAGAEESEQRHNACAPRQEARAERIKRQRADERNQQAENFRRRIAFGHQGDGVDHLHQERHIAGGVVYERVDAPVIDERFRCRQVVDRFVISVRRRQRPQQQDGKESAEKNGERQPPTRRHHGSNAGFHYVGERRDFAPRHTHQDCDGQANRQCGQHPAEPQAKHHEAEQTNSQHD